MLFLKFSSRLLLFFLFLLILLILFGSFLHFLLFQQIIQNAVVLPLPVILLYFFAGLAEDLRHLIILTVVVPVILSQVLMLVLGFLKPVHTLGEVKVDGVFVVEIFGFGGGEVADDSGLQ